MNPDTHKYHVEQYSLKFTSNIFGSAGVNRQNSLAGLSYAENQTR